ncbi:MAG: leucine--tRNA ligase, partial [Gammaproteobacteria bacterium]
RKSELERAELQKEKTGVFVGAYAINPANGKRIPIYIADYVLASYGTGAIMAVPAQDERDYDFAIAHGLPIVRTVEPPEGFEGGAYTGDGRIINSGFLDGLTVAEAKAKMIEWLEAEGKGRRKVNYKLRDWLFSRQRYWGEPFPILFVDGEPKTVPDDHLPVTLPDLEEFKPSGTPEGPLATARDWIETVDPETGKPARRETNTMPQWAGSCWYYLRYIDPQNDERLVDPEKERYWMPVDLYVGGSEHAVLHLLYARFWHKVLYDAGVVSTPEPFKKLVHQGMILGELEYTTYVRDDGAFVSAASVDGGRDTATGRPVTPKRIAEAEVEKQGDRFVLRADPKIVVDARAHKMSKSRGNVVNPDEIVAKHGADAFRLYEMFMGPLEQVKPWSTTGVEGTHRFLDRVWRLLVDERGSLSSKVAREEPTRDQLRVLHRTIAKVTEDIEALRMNTAIAALMELTNAMYKWDRVPHEAAEKLALLLSPFAPHISEELWSLLGHAESLAYAPWPEADPALLKSDTLEIPVQVNGKMRGRINVPADADQDTVIAIAREDDNVKRHLEGQNVRRAIYVPGRILNFVVGG